MDAPESFWKLCQRAHQDVFLDIENTEAVLADHLVRGLTASERRELAGFLERILPRSDADAVLEGFGTSRRQTIMCEKGHLHCSP